MSSRSKGSGHFAYGFAKHCVLASQLNLRHPFACSSPHASRQQYKNC